MCDCFGIFLLVFFGLDLREKKNRFRGLQIDFDGKKKRKRYLDALMRIYIDMDRVTEDWLGTEEICFFFGERGGS